MTTVARDQRVNAPAHALALAGNLHGGRTALLGAHFLTGTRCCMSFQGHHPCQPIRPVRRIRIHREFCSKTNTLHLYSTPRFNNRFPSFSPPPIKRRRNACPLQIRSRTVEIPLSVHSLFKFAAIEEAWLFIYHDGDLVLPPKDLTMIHLHVRVTLPAGVHMDITTSTQRGAQGARPDPEAGARKVDRPARLERKQGARGAPQKRRAGTGKQLEQPA